MFENVRATPDNWWWVYDVDMGTPLGHRYDWQGEMKKIQNNHSGLIRRDFTNAIVLMNWPNNADITVDLGGNFIDVDNNVIVTLSFINISDDYSSYNFAIERQNSLP